MSERDAAIELANRVLDKPYIDPDDDICVLARQFLRADSALADEKMEHKMLQEFLSRPSIDDFWEGILSEAGHQRRRWGEAHDRDKSAENWYWLIAYLAGKALRAAIDGDKAKAKHHTISSAAALFQWHQAISADESGHGIGRDADIAPPSAAQEEAAQ